jgi:hypothetical protein
MKRFILLFLLFVMCNVFADRIRIDVLQQPQPLYNYFYAISLDPDSPNNQIDLFKVKLSATAEPVPGDEYLVHVKLMWTGSDTPLLDLQEIRPKTTGNAYPLLPSGVIVHSADVISNETSSDFSANVDFDDVIDSSPDFKDAVLETGMFPDGTYYLDISAHDKNTGELISNEVSLQFRILNPSAITLIRPGRPTIGLPQVISFAFPDFAWISNLDEFIFYIYEVEEGMANQEEVETEEPLFISDNINSKNYVYPPNAPTLIDGKIYGWKITSILESSDINQDPLESNMRFFKYSRSNNGNVNTNPIVSMIESINDPRFNEIKQFFLEGYDLTDEMQFINEDISQTQLLQLLSKIMSNELTIKSITVE